MADSDKPVYRVDPNAVASEADFVLRTYEGEKPPAPDWFNAAIATPFERHSIEVDGAEIVYQSWGERSKPGLLLLHGNGAHAGWWDFIAPFLAGDYHVVAPNFSGMGESGWREAYSFATFVKEQIAVCEHAVLFDHETKPVVVAHSFGGFVAILMARDHGERFGGAVIVDTHIEPPGEDRPRPPARKNANRVYPDEVSALGRFRLAPLQTCDNHFIVDHIARHSLKRVGADEEGGPGFTWKFDPFIFGKLRGEWDEMDMTQLETGCPLVFMRGEDSILVPPDIGRYMSSLQSPPVPMISIPEAQHHVMLDQPLAFVTAVRGLLAAWPKR